MKSRAWKVVAVIVATAAAIAIGKHLIDRSVSDAADRDRKSHEEELKHIDLLR